MLILLQMLPNGLYQVAYRKETSNEVLWLDSPEECAQFQSLLGYMTLTGIQ
jgi:hypothetical protein